MQCGSDVL